MPSKNTIKIYVQEGIYHVYNRGVEKRNIFLDNQDYQVFLYYLKSYLLSPENPIHKKLPVRVRLDFNDFDLHKRIRLMAYCLMPNHFHLMLKQLDEKAMTEFVKRLSNAYVRYFNEKYERIGSLFQGRYKAVSLDKENYFLHLTRYIHRNPQEVLKKFNLTKLEDYPYSSYADYLGQRKTQWLFKDDIMRYFKIAQKDDPQDFLSYQDFVENYSDETDETDEVLGDLILE
ncbi:MAG: transposase [Patescibacteria group bacterium]